MHRRPGRAPSLACALVLVFVSTSVRGDAGEAHGPPAPRADGVPAEERPCSCRPEGCRFARLEPAEAARGESRGAVAAGAVLGLTLGAGLGLRSDGGGEVPRLDGPGGWDAALAGLGVAGLVGPALFEGDPPRTGAGAWSDCAADGRSALNGFDRWGRGLAAGLSRRSRARADALSDVLLHAGLAQPVGLILADGAAPDRGRDALVVLETYLLTFGLTNVAKHVWHRPRPFAHFGEPLDSEDMRDHRAELSFLSGHTSSTFAAAVLGGMLASEHRHPRAGWIWASGLTLAAATGTLRVAADRHYLTDVLAGAALGSLVGWLVPHLHRDGEAPAAGSAPRAVAPLAPLRFKLRGPPAGRRGTWLAVGLGAGTGFVAVSWRW